MGLEGLLLLFYYDYYMELFGAFIGHVVHLLSMSVTDDCPVERRWWWEHGGRCYLNAR